MAKLSKSQIQFAMRKAEHVVRTKLSDLRAKAPKESASVETYTVDEFKQAFLAGRLAWKEPKRPSESLVRYVSLSDMFEIAMTPRERAAANKAFEKWEKEFKAMEAKLNAALREFELELQLGDSEKALAGLRALQAL